MRRTIGQNVQKTPTPKPPKPTASEASFAKAHGVTAPKVSALPSSPPPTRQHNALTKVHRINRQLGQNHRRLAQLKAFSLAQGLKTSKPFGTSPRGVEALSPAQTKKLAFAPPGLVERRQQQAQTTKELSHTGLDVPTPFGKVHLSPLDLATLPAPGIGFGGDIARAGAKVGEVAAEKLAAKGAEEGGSKLVEAARAVRSEAKAQKIIRKTEGNIAKRAVTKVRRIPETAAKTAERLGTKAGRRELAIKGGAKAYNRPVASAAVPVAATPTSPGKKLRALAEANIKAPLSDPGKYAATTYKAAQGFVTVPIGIGIEAGASAIQRSPKPLSGELSKQVKGFKQFAGTELSGNEKRIQKATLESYGATPLIAGGLPLAAGLRHAGVHPLDYLRKGTEEVRKVRGAEHGVTPEGGTPHLFEKKRQRREESVAVAQHRLKGQIEVQRRGHPVTKAQHKAKGSETLRTVEVPVSSRSRIPVIRRLQKTKQELKIHTGQLAGFLVRHGIDPSKGPEHVLEQIRIKRASMAKGRREMGIKTLELPQESLHTRDVMHYIERHPEVLKDPELQKATDHYIAQGAYARQTSGMSPQHSEEGRWKSIMVTHGIAASDARVPHDLREKFGGAKTWQEALQRTKDVQTTHRDEVARLKREEKVARAGLNQANRTSDLLHEKAKVTVYGGRPLTSQLGLKRGARGQERKLIAAEEAKRAAHSRLERAQADLAQAQKDGLPLRQLRREAGAGVRRGTKGTPDQMAALSKEALGEARAVTKQQGLREPEYVYTGQAPTPFEKGGGPNFQNLPGGGRQHKKGTAETLGLVHEGNLVGQSIGVPVARREMFGALRDMFTRGGFSLHDGRQEATAKEWRQGIKDGTVPRNVVLVPRQTYQRAYDILKADEQRVQEQLHKVSKGRVRKQDIPQGSGDLPDEQWAHDLEQAASNDAQTNAWNDTSGTVYRAVQPERSKEFFAQLDKSRLSGGILKANKVTNFLILGTSPIWAALQFAAEGGQMAVQNPRILNPHWIKSKMDAYHAMPPHQRIALESIAGTTPRAIESVDDARTSLSSIQGEFADGYAGFQKTAMGNTLRQMPNTLRHIDTWKGGRIRLLAAMGSIDRETNGLVNHFLLGMGRLNKQIAHDVKATKGMTDSERYAYYMSHDGAAHRVGTNVDDMLGNWIALTRHERIAAPLSIFYPFLRMSLRWVFYSFPKHHPVLAATSAYLGMQNAIELKRLLHGDPSFFQYGQVPLHGIGPGGTSILNLSRVAPGQNTLLSMLGGDQGGTAGAQALGLLQPVPQAGITALTGVSPLGGKQKPEAGLQAVSQLTSLSPVAREAQNLLHGGPVTGGVPFLEGRGAQDAFDKLSQKLRTPTSKNPLTPPLPEPVGIMRDRVKFSQVISKLSANSSSKRHDVEIAAGTAAEQRDQAKVKALIKQHQQMERNYSQGTKQLNALYKKYKIPYQAESARFFKGYDAAKYGTSSSGSSGGLPDLSGSSGPTVKLPDLTSTTGPVKLPALK